jgi:serine/threonine protein kinase
VEDSLSHSPLSYSSNLSTNSCREQFLSSNLSRKYSLESVIGRGGSFYCTVFEATDQYQNKPVAIKQISLQQLQEEEYEKVIQTIENELNVYKRIGTHQNLVTLHYLYLDHGCYFFVMDCLLGGDLRSYLTMRGALDEQSTLYYWEYCFSDQLSSSKWNHSS